MRKANKTTILQRAIAFFFLLNLSVCSIAQPRSNKVIELHYFLLRPGPGENYINAFETLLIDTLKARRNYGLGQYSVKKENDHFV